MSPEMVALSISALMVAAVTLAPMRGALIATLMKAGCKVLIHASAVNDSAFGLKIMAFAENVWTIVRTIDASAARDAL
jgi:hypothetical protein